MSYILEALKKSDQQRRRGIAPTLSSVQLTPVSPERRMSWMYAVVAVALAVAAFAIGWVRPWQTPPNQESASVSPRLDDVEMNRSAIAPRSTPTTSAPSFRQAPEPAPEVVASRPSEVRPATPKSKKALPAAPATEESVKPAEGNTAVEEKKVVNFADLPAAVRQQIPPLTVSVHAYSNTAKDRLVWINDRPLHEGDSVSPDMLVEKITPEGMILSYKGTRFHRGVQ